jgi:hypothetical protein
VVTRAESSLDVVDGGVLVDRLPPLPFFLPVESLFRLTYALLLKIYVGNVKPL